ncbi:Cyclin, C-terminal domain [Musa troglodytarum]|uniref:Cyclin, C-terminal domain n=1 Tax=Musa troglodytarum TaxID=320322 RepID=A0A9E7GVJ7_9LILI|nr:Cyclin, C-terminal domain [Musa troglodytarum]URE18899.1 Cyclin, C-terminal domain [Musa troglodytarum]
MASRHQTVVPQQQRGGHVPAGKQKAGAAADGKNRRALGDIGNLVHAQVVEGKLEPQINRPITRSFGAQLLANAQAVAAVNKKPVAIKANAAVARGGTKPAKKVAVKGKEKKPEEEKVVVISPDKNQEVPKQAADTSRSRTKSTRKKVTTLTSVLTARSKVACGLTDKPKELVDDIDAADTEDELAVVDYVEDIYKFYKSAEHHCRPHDYMDSQVEINAKMRAILADWLIEVHHKFELSPETLYLTFCIIDRYLSMETVLRRELQLVGVSAMLIASKYEEIWAPEVNDFICISDRAYTREQILGMEKAILYKLEWNLTVPTPYVFLVRFLKAAAAACDQEMERMVFFFAELAMMHYSMIMFCPSMVAAAAVHAARCTLKKSPLWTATLKHHTGFSEQQLLDCTQMLVNSHAAAPEGKLKVVYKKYSSEQFGAVALQPSAAKLVEELKAASL